MAVGTLPKISEPAFGERPQPTPVPASAQPIIRLRGLGKTYKSTRRNLIVFDDLTCEIEKRSFLSIIGPSGCGKSTLLKLISGLEMPSCAQILFNDRLVEGPQ